MLEKVASEAKGFTRILSPHSGLWLEIESIRKVARKAAYRIKGQSAYGRSESFTVDSDRLMTVK